MKRVICEYLRSRDGDFMISLAQYIDSQVAFEVSTRRIESRWHGHIAMSSLLCKCGEPATHYYVRTHTGVLPVCSKHTSDASHMHEQYDDAVTEASFGDAHIVAVLLGMLNYTYDPSGQHVMQAPPCECVQAAIGTLLSFREEPRDEHVHRFLHHTDCGYANCMYDELRHVLIDILIRLISNSSIGDDRKSLMLSVLSMFKTHVSMVVDDCLFDRYAGGHVGVLQFSIRKKLSSAARLKLRGHTLDEVPDMMLRELLAPCMHAEYLGRLIQIFPDILDRSILTADQVALADNLGPKAAHKQF